MDNISKVVNHIHSEARRSQPSQTFSTRNMTSLDEITHNFTEDPAITRSFLEKYGQVFIYNERFTL